MNQKFKERVLVRSFALYRDKLNDLIAKEIDPESDVLLELLDNSVEHALFFERNAENIFNEQTAEMPSFQYNFTNQYQFNEE